MSNFAWAVLENIVLYAIALTCLLVLPGWWKLSAFAFLCVVNYRYPKS